MKQFIFSGILIVFATHAVFSQRVVTGRVVDKVTGEPVKKAKINLVGTVIETETNILGFFQLQVDSETLITITCPGYDDASARIPEVNSFKIELEKPAREMVQVPDEDGRVYLDDDEFKTGKANATSYRIVMQHPAESNKFLVEVYGMDDVIRSRGTYSDSEFYRKDGLFTYYHTNGKPKEEGFCRDNKRIGKWTQWYANGAVRMEGTYRNIKPDDGEPLKVDSFYDSLGNKLAANGTGIYRVEEEEPLSYAVGEISEGFKIGKWIGYFKNGKVAFEEEYSKGDLVKGISYDAEGNQYSYAKLYEADKGSGESMNEFYKFVRDNLRYPATARRRGIEGQVVVLIVVDSEFRIFRARVVQGVDKSLDEEALRVLLEFPGKFLFSLERGQKVPVKKSQKLYLPITFKLG